MKTECLQWLLISDSTVLHNANFILVFLSRRPAAAEVFFPVGCSCCRHHTIKGFPSHFQVFMPMYCTKIILESLIDFSHENMNMTKIIMILNYFSDIFCAWAMSFLQIKNSWMVSLEGSLAWLTFYFWWYRIFFRISILILCFNTGKEILGGLSDRKCCLWSR